MRHVVLIGARTVARGHADQRLTVAHPFCAVGSNVPHPTYQAGRTVDELQLLDAGIKLLYQLVERRVGLL